ncbi:MAG TPA: LLM class flavin-dependent oxidoreductase [Candidatus Nanopelagicaceae bacterium]|nr:LLM class flavin-dependent oxidoreductase [Candidatus Nanopelagicaceae bacterium]
MPNKVSISQQVGLVLGSALPPEEIASAAKSAERLGFDEIWIAEDMFFTGGIAGANLALGATEKLRVGLGVVSAVVRHPALLAIEISTTARSYPGRLLPGIGLGVPAWMQQIGLYPRSPITAVRECVDTVRRLLSGEEITSADGAMFHLDHVRLAHPISEEPSVNVGVIGPKMLEMAGEVGDGAILSVGAGLDYLQFARKQLDLGRQRSGRPGSCRVTQYAICSVSTDRETALAAAKEALTFYTIASGRNALTDAAGISDQVLDIIKSGGTLTDMAAKIPDEWVHELTIAGTPADVAARIRAFHEAGADSVALFPVPANAAVIEQIGTEVLPLLR